MCLDLEGDRFSGSLCPYSPASWARRLSFVEMLGRLFVCESQQGSGTIRQVSGTVGTLLRNSPKPSEAVPKRRRVGTIVKCRFGLQSSKDRIGLEITILEARKRKDRHPLLNRPPATPIHLPPGILLRLFSPFPPAQGRSGRRA